MGVCCTDGIVFNVLESAEPLFDGVTTLLFVDCDVVLLSALTGRYLEISFRPIIAASKATRAKLAL